MFFKDYGWQLARNDEPLAFGFNIRLFTAFNSMLPEILNSPYFVIYRTCFVLLDRSSMFWEIRLWGEHPMDFCRVTPSPAKIGN
jgi:hypothetical protein